MGMMLCVISVQIIQGAAMKEKKKNLEILFTFWWKIWKERSRRTFDQKEISAPRYLRRSLICSIRLGITSWVELLLLFEAAQLRLLLS
jgi:hypothetical protein